MKTFFSLLLVFLSTQFVKAQNLLTNSDFELFSNCPTYLGQVDSCLSWSNVISSSDFYNCNFLSYNSLFPTTPGAASGNGCVGFASYGNSAGSSEAIGQILAQPLLPGTTYQLSFAIKKTTGGTYGNICGGLAVYGTKDISLPHNLVATHISQVPGFISLGVSDTIQNTVWLTHTITINCPDTINSVVISMAFTPNCGEYIFLDSLNLNPISTSLAQLESEVASSIFPNPFSDNLTIQVKNSLPSIIMLYDIYGKKLIEQEFVNSMILDAQYLANGIYIYEVRNKNVVIKKGKVIKQ